LARVRRSADATAMPTVGMNTRGRSGLSAPARKSDTLPPMTPAKERIVWVAAELFAAKGYHATGVAELSDAVHLGRGALYHHIGSKENVLYEITARQLFTMLDLSEDIAASDLPAQEKMRQLARRLMENIAEHRAEWQVFFREHTALTGERLPEILADRERYEQIWLTVMQDGVAAGELKPFDPIAVKGILGIFNYSVYWLSSAGRLSPDAIADMFVDIVLQGMST
jgi:AcrR family transcriptional regulator